MDGEIRSLTLDETRYDGGRHDSSSSPNSIPGRTSRYRTQQACGTEPGKTLWDRLLREHVFVDLYRVVQQGLCVGGKNYSLKTIERLYRAARSSDVADAGASIVAYASWRESGQSPHWRESPLLKQIRDYNEDDCVSIPYKTVRFGDRR